MDTKQYDTKNKWVNEEIKEEIIKILRTNENKNTFLKSMRPSKSSSNREVYNDIGTSRNKKNLK